MARTIKLIPYSKERFPEVKFVNGIPIEEATNKYKTVSIITDKQGKPVRTGEDYFIDEQGNPLKPKELQEVTITAPAHLSDEEYRQYLLNSQDFNRRQGLPIDYDNIPLFTYDNGITGKRNVNRNTYERYIEADNKSREFNKQMDAIVAGATGIMASPYILGAAAAIPFHSIAPGTVAGNFVGDAAGSMAGMEASNLLSKKLTGKTVDQHINRALSVDDNSFTGQWITPMLNPAGYATMAFSPIINAPKTAVTEFADNLAKQYTNQVNPGLVKKSQRVLQNSWDKAKQTVYDKWNKFNQIPEIELLRKYPKVIFDKTKFISNNPGINPINAEINHIQHLIDKQSALQFRRYPSKNVFDSVFYQGPSIYDEEHVPLAITMSKLTDNPSLHYQHFFTRDPVTVNFPLRLRNLSNYDLHNPNVPIETKSTVYNPFTGTSIPIRQKQLLEENLSSLDHLTLEFNHLKRSQLENPSAKYLLRLYGKTIPVISNIRATGFTTRKFSPIQTVEGDLQKGAQEIKTSIENAIGDEGLVAGSVYKLSNGHFQGSNLQHNPNSAPHDIEIWTYSNEAADDIAKKLGLTFTGTGRITRKYHHPNGTEFEFAVIGKNPDTGKAKGDLAWQLFETYNPDEALAIKRQHIFNGTPYQNVDLPITPEELYQVYQKNPQLMDRRTVLDTITAASNSIGSNGLSTKQKHSDRTAQMLMNPQNAERMNDAISHLYKQIWGTTEGEKKLPSKVYQAIDYNDIEANKFFLEKLGFSKKVSEKMATNPQQMQNVFNYWYLQKMCGKRFGSFNGNRTEDNALQVLSTNVSPDGMYARGGGGNSDISPVWNWNGDFTGLIYNPLTYKPETITNLQKAVEKYESQHDIYEDVLKFTRNQGESLDDYIKRVAQQSQDLDIPINQTEDNYLGRFSAPKKEDVGQLQTGESVKVGGVFAQQGTTPITTLVSFPGIPSTGNYNWYSIDDILKHSGKFRGFIEELKEANPQFKEILEMSEKNHISFTDAFNQKYRELLQEAAKVEHQIAGIKSKKAFNRPYEMAKFQYERGEQQLRKLEHKLETLKNQKDKYADAAVRINSIVKNGEFYGGLAGVGTGIGTTIYKISKDNKKEREEKDSQYVQQLTQGTPQQAMVQLEIDKEKALNKCHNDIGKANIEEHYEELKSKLVDYYSKESNAKIVNESPIQSTGNASIAQAVQNARKKHRLGGILKYK